jgi:hypothetical protein
MRYAVLGVLLFAAALAAAIVGLILAPLSLEELRDIVIVVYGVMGILLLVALIIAILGLWLAVRVLTRALARLLEDPIRPTLHEFHATARNVRGTSDFIADSTVHPLIRILAVGRGIRRGVGMVARLARRRR